ncbi:MAG: endolytic transglycosylase MltG [Pseudomonadota bacterium]
MRLLSIIFSFIFLIFALISGTFFYVQHDYQKTSLVKEDRNFIISKGASLRDMRDKLATENFISDISAFILPYIVRAHGQDKTIKAGEYAIPKGSSAEDIIDIFVSGKTILHKITFPEGETVYMMLERIKANDILTGDMTLSPEEGMMEPETYLFSRGMTRDKLIQQMIERQKKNLNGVWEKRPEDDFPIHSKEELLILASIVEKETALASERPMVASVFLNRLRKKMRLQTDPTIIYGITGGKTSFKRPIYRSDLIRDTGYNTYIIDRLPPTPICNPGRHALEAVVSAPKTDYLYFVANGTGGHSFSRTLKEHNKNVRIWRKIERNTKSPRLLRM